MFCQSVVIILARFDLWIFEVITSCFSCLLRLNWRRNEVFCFVLFFYALFSVLMRLETARSDSVCERINRNHVRSVLSHASSPVMEGREGRCQGDFSGFENKGGGGGGGVGILGRWGVTSQSQRDRRILIKPPPRTHTFLFAFILTLQIKISCCNYCSVRRPNSAKSIASQPSGAIESIWRQLFMSFTCSSGLQWKVMALLRDVCWSTGFWRAAKPPGSLPRFPLH